MRGPIVTNARSSVAINLGCTATWQPLCSSPLSSGALASSGSNLIELKCSPGPASSWLPICACRSRVGLLACWLAASNQKRGPLNKLPLGSTLTSGPGRANQLYQLIVRDWTSPQATTKRPRTVTTTTTWHSSAFMGRPRTRMSRGTRSDNAQRQHQQQQ